MFSSSIVIDVLCANMGNPYIHTATHIIIVFLYIATPWPLWAHSRHSIVCRYRNTSVNDLSPFLYTSCRAEGIYRVPGSKQTVDRLKEGFVRDSLRMQVKCGLSIKVIIAHRLDASWSIEILFFSTLRKCSWITEATASSSSLPFSYTYLAL